MKFSPTFTFPFVGFTLLLSFALKPVPSYSQQNSANELATKQFREGFLKGCIQGKTPGVKNQIKYCNCMADSFQSRYDGTSLTTISQLSASVGVKGPALVNLMVLPEAKACIARN
jgi:hypothetical protein